MLFNKILTVSVLLVLLFTVETVNAAIKYDNLFCDGCSDYTKRNLAISRANGSDAEYVIVDTINSTIQIYVVIQPDTNEAPDEEGSDVQVVVKKSTPELLTANIALSNLLKIGEELRSEAETNHEITLSYSFPYESAFEVLMDNLSREDFVRALQESLNEDLHYQEKLERAKAEIITIDSKVSSSLNIGIWSIGKDIGLLIKTSTWIVVFRDNSRILVDLTFKKVGDKIVVKAIPDFTFATDSEENSIPLSLQSAGEYTLEGATQLGFLAAWEYLENLGMLINYDRGDSDPIYDMCMIVKVNCNGESCEVENTCSN